MLAAIFLLTFPLWCAIFLCFCNSDRIRFEFFYRPAKSRPSKLSHPSPNLARNSQLTTNIESEYLISSNFQNIPKFYLEIEKEDRRLTIVWVGNQGYLDFIGNYLTFSTHTIQLSNWVKLPSPLFTFSFKFWGVSYLMTLFSAIFRACDAWHKYHFSSRLIYLSSNFYVCSMPTAVMQKHRNVRPNFEKQGCEWIAEFLQTQGHLCFLPGEKSASIFWR